MSDQETKLLSLSEKLGLLVQTGIPVLITGFPGEAKTAVVQAIATATGRHLETVIASIREASEIGGLPIDRPEGVILHPPAWARRLVQNPGGMAFFDEFTTVLPAVQAALLRVIHEKIVGELVLPKQTWMVAAANPPEIAANGWELSAPMANRFIHLPWQLDADMWIQGMMSGFTPPKVSALPTNWQEGIPPARAFIATFIKSRPALLRQFPKNESERSGPWPSPRTWDMAATVYAAFVAAGHDPVLGVETCVGTGAASEFLEFFKNLNLPDPEELLAHPDKIRWPERDDQSFAMLSSVVAVILAKNQPSRWLSGWKVIHSAVQAQKNDLAAVVARTLAINKPKNAENPTEELAALTPILQQAGVFES